MKTFELKHSEYHFLMKLKSNLIAKVEFSVKNLSRKTQGDFYRFSKRWMI